MNKDNESYKKRQRYWKIYYEIHREEKRAYDRAKYVPHPRPKIIRTPEEQKQLDEFKKERARKYYQEHKEYYKQKNHEHYLRNKNNPEYKKRKNEATKRYLNKRSKANDK